MGEYTECCVGIRIIEQTCYMQSVGWLIIVTFQYFEMRFASKLVRIIAASLGILMAVSICGKYYNVCFFPIENNT